MGHPSTFLGVATFEATDNSSQTHAAATLHRVPRFSYCISILKQRLPRKSPPSLSCGFLLGPVHFNLISSLLTNSLPARASFIQLRVVVACPSIPSTGCEEPQQAWTCWLHETSQLCSLSALSNRGCALTGGGCMDSWQLEPLTHALAQFLSPRWMVCFA